MVLYFEPLRMSENVLDPPLTRRNSVIGPRCCKCSQVGHIVKTRQRKVLISAVDSYSYNSFDAALNALALSETISMGVPLLARNWCNKCTNVMVLSYNTNSK